MLTLLLTSLLALAKHAPAPPLPAWAQGQWTQAGLNKTFERKTYAKPGFLQADFNGDGKIDVAILAERLHSRSRGIIILHQGLPVPHVLGAGPNTHREILRGDFSWVDQWSLYIGSTTHEVMFSSNGDLLDTRQVRLKRPTIELIKEEQGGGMIYWNGKRYVWLHQTC
ncbi:MAG TPA: hypothetical protein VF690_11420 [Hymenobacter sp.]|jgi:hypothetical protein